MAEFRYLISLFFCAWAMGAVFDVYNVVTGASKWTRWLQPLLDLVFWIVSAGFVYYVLFVTDDGRLRMYTLVLLALGYGAYFLVLHKRVVGSAFLVVRIIRWTGLQIYRVVQLLFIRPIKFVLSLCWILLTRIYQCLCFVEDGLFFVLRFWLKLLFWPFRGTTRYLEQPLSKIRLNWEGIWTRASNWLR